MHFILRRSLIIVVFTTYFSISADGQESISKSDWNIGFMPALAYNSDLGLLYGGMLQVYDYGDGSVYPLYNQSLLLQVSAYTRGSQSYALSYESFTLLTGLRVNAKLSFHDSKAYQFFGFNGYETVYNRDWEDADSPEYISRVFYRYERKVYKLSLRLKDTIGSGNFMWSLGVDLSNFSCGPVDIDKLNGRKKNNELPLPDVDGLYSRYIDWGLIGQDEKEGGSANSFIYGLAYDSRNKLSNPDNGIFTELNLRYTPCFLGAGDYHNTRLSLIHRQYIPLVRNSLTFAYRLVFDYTLSGRSVFYDRTNIPSYNPFEGYGGELTIRGIMKNRLVGESFALVNLELRSRLVDFQFLNQNWFVGINVFLDSGRILKTINLDTDLIDQADREIFFSADDNNLHTSFGIAGKLVMNENFVMSAEFARAADIRDGLNGIYLGIDYLF